MGVICPLVPLDVLLIGAWNLHFSGLHNLVCVGGLV